MDHLLGRGLAAHSADGIGEPIDSSDFETFNGGFWSIRSRDHSKAKAELGGFLQPFLSTRGRSNFPRKPYFSKHNRPRRQRPIRHRTDDSQQHSQIACGFSNFYAADSIYKNILVKAGQAGVPVQELSAVLDSRPWFEHNWMGYTYLIAVHDYVPKGGAAPYDYSRDRIRNLILSRRKQELVTSLERNVLNDAIASDKFIIY